MSLTEAWILMICSMIPFLVILIYVGDKISNALERFTDVISKQFDQMDEDIEQVEDDIDCIFGRLERLEKEDED